MFTSTNRRLGTGGGVAVGAVVGVAVGGTGELVGALTGLLVAVGSAVRVGTVVAVLTAGCRVLVATGGDWPPGLRIAVAVGLKNTGWLDGVALAT
jgi:hypothetical protein